MRTILLSLMLLFLPALAGAAELRVFAASSLTEALQDVAASYRLAHPDTDIDLHFAGSQALAAQIEQGAPADLFISANPAAMARLERAGLVETPRIIAGNRLALAITPEAAGKIRTPADLARPGLLLAIGNPQVPIGAYTRQLLDRLAADPAYGAALVNAIRTNVVSEENKVKAIVAKLLLGEADAGIVYQSDLQAPSARRLVSRALPCDSQPLARYPAAVLKDKETATATDFLAYLGARSGQQILQRHGLLPAGGDQ